MSRQTIYNQLVRATATPASRPRRPSALDAFRVYTERFETLPGGQAQADWGECGTITVEGETTKLYCFVLVLGYSRMCFARFTTST